MGATTSYGFRYPELTDAPNGPLGFRNLAEDIEDELERISIVTPLAPPKGVIGTASRITNGTLSTGTEYSFLTVSAPVKAGRLYRAGCYNGGFTTSGARGIACIRLRYATGGATAGVTSPQFSEGKVEIPNSGDLQAVASLGYIIPGSDTTLSVAYTYYRAAGTGSVGPFASDVWPTVLVIEDLGVAVSETGTVV